MKILDMMSGKDMSEIPQGKDVKAGRFTSPITTDIGLGCDVAHIPAKRSKK